MFSALFMLRALTNLKKRFNFGVIFFRLWLFPGGPFRPVGRRGEGGCVRICTKSFKTTTYSNSNNNNNDNNSNSNSMPYRLSNENVLLIYFGGIYGISQTNITWQLRTSVIKQ